ncbi:MAG: aspartate carbamoyltransferase catalytic subunit [Oscillospiraceae bacterium]|nr:aspartate carbamoyltransferase catalytic subunit [Oscillospiraceae bacterium]
MDEISLEEIDEMLETAQMFYDGKEDYKRLTGKIACNLFFEPSTRTQYSFQIAEEKLEMKVISFNKKSSSIKKNESFFDTVKTFDSFGIDLLIIRSLQNEYYKELAGKIKTKVINAGDGTSNHPTQSLLDILTIKQEFGFIKGLKILMVGDILHSRVAHSNLKIMKRLGAKVFISGPNEYLEKDAIFIPLEDGLLSCDVVIMLRVQFERHDKKFNMSFQEYNEKFGINSKNIGFMKKNSIIMHPGPVNRNVEISDNLVECEKSRILKQVKNGVFVRMAVIEYLLRNK